MLRWVWRQAGKRFRREGGWEGLYAYAKSIHQSETPLKQVIPKQGNPEPDDSAIDRTAKLFIAGKQVRSDSGYSFPIFSNEGKQMGLVGKETGTYPERSRIANAASSWSKSTAHLRAQILYFLGENLSIRADEFAVRISDMTGDVIEKSRGSTIFNRASFSYAAWADKYDGAAMEHRFVALLWR